MRMATETRRAREVFPSNGVGCPSPLPTQKRQKICKLPRFTKSGQEPIDHGERGNLQPAFGTTRTAVEEVPETERLLATLREEGRVMRRDQFRARVERRHEHALMKVWPGKWLPKLPCDGAFSVVTVATQVAEVDTTAQHKDRDEQRGQELPLWLTEAGHLFQDVVDNCHKPFTG